MKLIAWWIGTDALTLVKNPPAMKVWYIKLYFYRLKWRILNRFFEHWVVHENLGYYLDEFGIQSKLVVYPADYDKEIEKKAHNGFNVLYYRPSKPANLGSWKYLNWYYGYDIFLLVKRYFSEDKDIHFILADGTHENIDELYAITDVYIRPNRWDGTPRMIQECRIKRIPFYWSSQIGKDGYLNPSASDVIKFIRKWKSLS